MRCSPRFPRHGCWPLLVAALCAAPPLGAQSAPSAPPRAAWNDSAAVALARRAIARRMGELADTSLHDWRATARGHLAFLGQLGDGWIETPRLVQTEELALELAWKQPGVSTQRLVGRRDSLLLPGNVGYYRSRYAVVLNDLPDRIRLGDGQDVRDVPHPLAPDGLTLYDVAVGDTVRIRLPGGAIEVRELRVRPRDPTAPRVVGTVYLDVATAAVVRLGFTFTAAALLDRRIETLAVTLENRLVQGRWWLPSRQEVEVARRDAWLDIPARGVVRGRWSIGQYQVNDSVPPPAALFERPAFSVAPPDSLKAFPFEGSVLAALPADIQLTTDEEVREVRLKAEAAVRDAVLARRGGTALAGRGASDAIRITRAEGVAVGVGVSRPLWGVLRPSARVRYGFGDRTLKGRLGVARLLSPGSPATGVELFAERDYRDLIRPERSGVANSLGALVGSDMTAQVDARAVGVALVRPLDARRTLRAELAVERQDPLAIRFTPPTGRFAPVPQATPADGVRARLDWAGAHRGEDAEAWRITWRVGGAAARWVPATERFAPVTELMSAPLALTVAPSPSVLLRGDGELSLERSWREGQRGVFLAATAAGQWDGGGLLPQHLVFAGGPVSAPGYEVASLAGRALATVRAEWRVAVPFVPIPLRQFGTAPPRMTLIPFVHAVGVGGLSGNDRVLGGSLRPSGLFPSAGLGARVLFDLIRVDVARGLRDGRWMLNIDVDRAFWGVL